MRCIQLDTSNIIVASCEWPDATAPDGWIELPDDIAADLPQDFAGWGYVDGALVEPAPPPPPTPEQILAMNTAQRASLMTEAAGNIDALQDVVDYGTPTDAQTAALTAWRTYRAALMAVDLTAYPAAWPTKPTLP